MLANREKYAKQHGQGQVYKKTYPGDKVGMTKAYAYDIKRAGPKGKLPKESTEEAMLPKSAFAGSDKNKLGRAGQLMGKDKRPAKAGDLVGTEEAVNPAQQAAIAIAKKKEKGVDEEKQRLDPKCWKGYKKQGTKMKGGKRVNNCVPVGETAENILGRLIRILESK